MHEYVVRFCVEEPTKAFCWIAKGKELVDKAKVYFEELGWKILNIKEL